MRRRADALTTETLIKQFDSESALDVVDRLASSVETTVPASSDTSGSLAKRRMHCYAELTSLPFTCVDAKNGVVLARTVADSKLLLPAEVLRQLSAVDALRVIELPSELIFYLLPLPDFDDLQAVAVGCVLARRDARPHDLALAAAEENWSQTHLDQWLSRQTVCSPEELKRLLFLALSRLEHETTENRFRAEIENLSQRIEDTYEEITLLLNLTHNLQISRSPAELADLCLAQMHSLIKSAGNAIWIEEKNGTPHCLV